jgi:hypothetical protein
MASYRAEGLSYPNAVSLVNDLQTAGISANIGTGCVHIQMNPEKVAEATQICEKYGTVPTQGSTSTLMTQTTSRWRPRRR